MPDPTPRPLRVFLCHSSGDKPIVRDLYQKLSAEGWIDVWLDEQKLLPGMDWNLEIEKAVEEADVIIVCLSNNSVTKEGYVQRELKYALDIALEKPEGTIFVIPLRLDNCEPPRRLRGWQYADYFPENLRAWAYQRVLEGLKARAKHLNLSTNAFESTPIPRQALPSLETPQISQSVAPYPYVSAKSTASVAHPGAATKRNRIWFYGRLTVVLLLISGFFVFGTWSVYLIYARMLFSGIIQIIPLVMPSLAFIVLLLVTLARLVPWKFMTSTAIVRLERLVAGIACISIFGSIDLALTSLSAPSRGLGFWLANVGVDLAAINILFELRSAIQKGQKLPWWAWLLVISIILPWLALFWLLYGK